VCVCVFVCVSCVCVLAHALEDIIMTYVCVRA
jgi:hypothetical protein